jgi:hypothetical protein
VRRIADLGEQVVGRLRGVVQVDVLQVFGLEARPLGGGGLGVLAGLFGQPLALGVLLPLALGALGILAVLLRLAGRNGVGLGLLALGAGGGVTGVLLGLRGGAGGGGFLVGPAALGRGFLVLALALGLGLGGAGVGLGADPGEFFLSRRNCSCAASWSA